MTGAQTEPIRVSKFEQATSILLHIAHQLFYKAIFERESEEVVYLAWSVLRLIAERFLATRSTILVPSERERLNGALKVAHDLTHPEHKSIPLERCTCLMSLTQRELAFILAEAEAEAGQ
jgi:hypothetical protein